MFYLILQTALLILAAFVVGAITGCLLHRLFAAGGPFSHSVQTPAVQAPAEHTSTAQTHAAPVAAASEPVQAPPAQTVAAPAKAETAKSAAANPADTPSQPSPEAAVDTMDDAAAEAALAALPADASNEEKANAVGTRPVGLDAPHGGTKDNLQRIKGIGKVNEGKLNDLGLYHFSQIRDWTPSEARWVGTFLSFAGRIEREDWIGQARVLASGGETDFAKRVDKGQVSSSSNKKK